MLDILADRFVYIPVIVLMMTGLYVVFATGNLVKRLVGLSLFQTSVFLLYIAMGKVFGGQPPILPSTHHGEDDGHGAGYGAEAAAYGSDYASSGDHGDAADHVADAAHGAADYAADAAHHAGEAYLYSNPLPHVLILTAIVVGVATLAVGLALVVRIREAYGVIEDDALNAADYSLESGGTD